MGRSAVLAATAPLYLCLACSVDDKPADTGARGLEAPRTDAGAIYRDEPDAAFPREPCPDVDPEPVPPELGLDPFYEKYVDVDGLPIVSSARVSDAAFRVASFIVKKMTGARPDLLARLVDQNVRVGILAETEATTDLPEHRDLYAAFPMIDWDRRARGLGATLERPLSSVGEENLLQLSADRYRGESIMVHEFSHTLFDIAVRSSPGGRDYERRLRRAYSAAVRDGLWAGTYAATGAEEYWAEGVQSFFDANLEAVPADGLHNHVDTRRELTDYDPRLANLIFELLGDAVWSPYCQL